MHSLRGCTQLGEPVLGRAAAAQVPSKALLGSARPRSILSAVRRAVVGVGGTFARKLWQELCLT